MDVHSEYMEPVTPGLTYDNVGYWKTEDSGYHTSYTPGSLECSEISSENLNPIFKGQIGFTGQFQVGCYDIQSEVSFRPKLQFSSGILRSRENHTESPQNRRGIKRTYNGEPENRDASCGSVPTPTSMIAGGLCKLRFSDKKLNGSYSSVSFDSADLFVGDLSSKNDHTHTPYPTTPIKKLCRSSCKLSSPLNPRKPVKKLNFAIHSLLCDAQALQPINKISVKPHNSTGKVCKFRPNQKIDIIKMLYQEGNVMPPIMKIFSYLSNEDIFNFTLVSPLWQKVWEDVSKVKCKKQEYLKYLKNVRDNQENKRSTPKSSETNQIRPLMEIHNVLNNHNVITKSTSTPISPPGTPNTIKFKKFAKAASLDLRKQLSCARCQQPAKVTEESTGEEWVECTSVSCSYQYCKFCKCDRHPGKDCFKYDLDGPSPSKRKKNTCAVASKKSRKNLRRLL